MHARRAAWVAAFAVLLFGFAAARHALHQSGAYDLACFDQPLYLLSRGLPPISTVMGVQLLGDHAAWALWAIAPLYRLWPSPLLLLALQALALALGAWTALLLARQAGCDPRQARLVAGAYAAYPLVFNANLFDFHPDAFAPALLMGALYLARAGRPIACLACCLAVAGLKEALGLTVAGLGLLLLFERRRIGILAVLLGLVSFGAGVAWIIPACGGGPGALVRYAYLGGTPREVLINVFTAPGRWLPRVCSLETLVYMVYVFAPFGWALRWRYLRPLVAAVPALALNVLADYPAQHDVVHHYALPVLPFLVAAAAGCVAAGKARERWALAWMAVGFLALAKPYYFLGPYLQALDTVSAADAATARVPPDAAVLTTHELAPHLAHRARLAFTDRAAPPDLAGFDAVLLDLRHPGWRSDPAFATALQARLAADPRYHLAFAREGVWLYLRTRQADKT